MRKAVYLFQLALIPVYAQTQKINLYAQTPKKPKSAYAKPIEEVTNFVRETLREQQKGIVIEEKTFEQFKELVKRQQPLEEKSIVIFFIAVGRFLGAFDPSYKMSTEQLYPYCKPGKTLLIPLTYSTVGIGMGDCNLVQIHKNIMPEDPIKDFDKHKLTIRDKIQDLLQAPSLEMQEIITHLADLNTSLSVLQKTIEHHT